MKTVLILSNHHLYTYNLRKEIIQRLIDSNYKVVIALPYGEKVELLKEMGCEFIDILVDRRGTNPISDFKLFLFYRKIIKQIKPDVVLTYTIKPNVYGGMACSMTKTPYITNVTGLGTSVQDNGLMQNVALQLYRIGLTQSSCILFQNNTNQMFFREKNIIKGETKLIPGSGVNLKLHKYEEYPVFDNEIRLLFIGRIMKAKGIEELLEAAMIVKRQHSNVQFDLIGSMEEDYEQEIQELEKEGIVKYYGQQTDVHSFIKNSHATVLPSYHEGLANVLLESASSGRPILASKVPGCIETFEDGITGFGFEVKNVDSLVAAINEFLNLSYPQKKEMGYKGRLKVEKEFDRELVIDTYLKEINRVTSASKESYK
ncbi:glycosyltransferase family 1 protein [Sporosarcina sp. P16b]|uniref:glycosyltransferase family 4 protein n=1 Tax=Sporosarcina sp. P16b TaxID=2048261 RepID=UPI000C1704F2|nr:glycosyltransferase family 4 protein [Sporosarcina sp. P16b]PIC69184.1 glycosyltransferase family 1 protein [Sporosarcina sp. P16b]